MVIDVIPANEWDAAYIAANARAIDRLEAKYQTGLPIEEALRTTMSISPTHAYTGRLDGEPVVMFGAAITNALEQAAAPWLLATDKLPLVQLRFLRECRPQLHTMVSDFADMRNIVYEGNIVAVRWLSWMGFSVGAPSRQGPFRVSFREFYWDYAAAVPEAVVPEEEALPCVS